MSDIVGGKAIALAQSGGIEEVTHARTFVVPARGYTVTIGARPVGASPRYECTCPAVGRCYHGEAAQLVMAKQRETGVDGREAYVMREMARLDVEFPEHRPWEKVVADVRAAVEGVSG